MTIDQGSVIDNSIKKNECHLGQNQPVSAAVPLKHCWVCNFLSLGIGTTSFHAVYQSLPLWFPVVTIDLVELCPINKQDIWRWARVIHWVPDHKDYQEPFPQIAHFGQAAMGRVLVVQSSSLVFLKSEPQTSCLWALGNGNFVIATIKTISPNPTKPYNGNFSRILTNDKSLP